MKLIEICLRDAYSKDEPGSINNNNDDDNGNEKFTRPWCPFLVQDSFIETDLYTKSTDKHQHLLTSFCHSQHTKQALYSLYTLALRLRCICSNQDSYLWRINKLIDCVINPDKTFFKTTQRASNVPRTDAPKNKPNKRTAGHTLRHYIKNPALPNIGAHYSKALDLDCSSNCSRNGFEKPSVFSLQVLQKY